MAGLLHPDICRDSHQNRLSRLRERSKQYDGNDMVEQETWERGKQFCYRRVQIYLPENLPQRVCSFSSHGAELQADFVGISYAGLKRRGSWRNVCIVTFFLTPEEFAFKYPNPIKHQAPLFRLVHLDDT